MPVSPISGTFVENGTIRYGALFGTVLGAAWLVLVGGLITVQNAIVSMQVRLLEAVQFNLVSVISAFLGGGADLSRTSWATGYEAAVQTAPLIAPLTFALEIILVLGILGTVAKRQELFF